MHGDSEWVFNTCWIQEHLELEIKTEGVIKNLPTELCSIHFQRLLKIDVIFGPLLKHIKCTNTNKLIVAGSL